jgi:hypothetical protein
MAASPVEIGPFSASGCDAAHQASNTALRLLLAHTYTPVAAITPTFEAALALRVR